MKKIRVNASGVYDILIARDILQLAGEYVTGLVKGRSAAVVTDDIVDSLYAQRLCDSLLREGIRPAKFIIPNGETSKNAENYISLLNFLAKESFSRADLIIALGGGVVGDLAGFAAATYMRGIKFVQIPTTLLAMVDSSVGGKTALNLNTGKNLAGAFHQPSLVLCDCETLSTLKPEVYRDGCAEIIKYGILASRELFDAMKTPNETDIEEIIAECVKIKRDIVCEDEFETGKRKLLNLGHTVAHAIEALSAYEITHGRAVAAGTAVIARAAAEMDCCSKECCDEIIEILKLYELPITTEFDAPSLCAAILNDKKREGEAISLVIPEAIGRCTLLDLPVSGLERLIGSGLKQGGEVL